MKYEMIFGDEALFDGAPDDCFCVAKNVYDDRVFYKEVDRCLFWLDCEKWKPLQFMSCTPLAMRRIIKEPKRWTWEDKKAGRLPEVCGIFTYRDETLTCHFIDGDGEIWAHDIDNKIVTPLLRDCQPIETPAEKAQREEDEFVEELASGVARYDSFINGARAAYRKLKGGEGER